MTVDLYPYPRFSLQERDRRWREVRRRMAQQELTAVVCPAHSGHSTDFQANSRYLSHCGGGGDADIAVVLPLEGDVTVAATSAAPRWPTVQNWVHDIREARRDYGKVILDRLGELGVDGRRVGIAGLGAGTRSPEGTVLHHTMRRLLEGFPQTRFVDATPILDEVRAVKSQEELDFLQRSNDLVDAGYEAIRATARPGVSDHVVWAEATAAMLRGGSELPVHCNWVSGPRPPRTLTRPSHRLLEAGDIIINELESSWAGYRAQGDQPICVQRCDPEYVELLKVQGAIFDRMMEMLRPGITVAELSAACEAACREASPASGPAAGCSVRLTMHGRGQGDDGPIITSHARDPRQLARALEANMVFILKPSVACADGSHPVCWGDTVVVTPGGGRRMGKREQGVWVA